MSTSSLRLEIFVRACYSTGLLLDKLDLFRLKSLSWRFVAYMLPVKIEKWSICTMSHERKYQTKILLARHPSDFIFRSMDIQLPKGYLWQNASEANIWSTVELSVRDLYNLSHNISVWSDSSKPQPSLDFWTVTTSSRMIGCYGRRPIQDEIASELVSIWCVTQWLATCLCLVKVISEIDVEFTNKSIPA